MASYVKIDTVTDADGSPLEIGEKDGLIVLGEVVPPGSPREHVWSFSREQLDKALIRALFKADECAATSELDARGMW